MKTKEIRELMIVFNDNDFYKVFDWIGQVIINMFNDTATKDVLDTSDKIERFIKSLIPIGLEFIYSDNYYNLPKDLIDSIKIKCNFSREDLDWKFNGSETVIIDFENNISYIR